MIIIMKVVEVEADYQIVRLVVLKDIKVFQNLKIEKIKNHFWDQLDIQAIHF